METYKGNMGVRMPHVGEPSFSPSSYSEKMRWGRGCKNSYALETFQNDNQDKVKPFEN